MNTKLPLLIVFLIHTHYSFSQLKGSSYQFPERFSKNYFFDPNLSYQRIKDFQVKGFTADQMDYYKIMKTYDVQRDFDNNSYYLEWYDLEKYLYKLVDTLMPAEIKAKQPYDVFIKRDIDYNASALGNGFVFANIGLIANCKNEAELAYILGHEIGHSIFNHGYMINAGLVSAVNKNDYSAIFYNYEQIFNKSQYAELQSDSFAYRCIEKANYNLNAAYSSLNLIAYSEFTNLFYVEKNDRVSYNAYMNSVSTHPSFQKRKQLLDAFTMTVKPNNNNYLIDSVYFNKVKKIAHEECKKISMETGDYENSLKLSFVDYLLGDNGLKNLFYIIESTRRLMYMMPEKCNSGFLAEDLKFTEFNNTNYGALQKPEILFMEASQLEKAKQHPLLKTEQKAFNTYEQAYLYFIKLAEEKNFNEAKFSKALYYYSKKDDINFKAEITAYLEKGGGVSSAFANNLKEFGSPTIKSGKTAVFIDNASNFSHNDNYYHSLQRISYNNDIYAAFKTDTAKIELVLMNELMGIQPKKLFNYQKLQWHINRLYTETDEEVFYKKRYFAKEDMEERSKKNKFNKNLMIFAPEFYNWFIENNLNGFFCQQIAYEYQTVKELNEYHNLYYIGYFNFYDNRPYFGKCIRNGNIRKQKMAEMAADARNFLFYKE